MNFCDNFKTNKEAEDKFPNKKCESCPNYLYEEGTVLCKKIKDKVENKE